MVEAHRLIEYARGNIFDAGVEALVNPVNCVGVMGAGLALEFKHRFPGNYKLYREACERGEVQLGRVHAVVVGVEKYVVNFPTKHHWLNRSHIQDIEYGLVDLQRNIRALRIKSIAIPALGCGLGGLSWGSVKPVIETYLCMDDVQVVVYEPRGVS